MITATPRYDLVTVVYDEEVELLALQAKSIDLFGRRLSIGRIYIIANGPRQDRTIRRLRAEVVPKYGRRGSQVEIVPARELMELSETTAGWYSQQVLKLAIARRVRSKLYITLDAKNHLIRESDDGIFFSPAGTPLFHPASLRDMSINFVQCANICGIDAAKYMSRAYPSITPAVLYTSHVCDLHGFLEESGYGTLEDMICRKRMAVTEYMLYYCYLCRIGAFDSLYTPGPRLVITLWTIHVDIEVVFQGLMAAVEARTVPFFSLHRLARRRLTREQSLRIARLWCNIGLVGNEREARVYLDLKLREKAMDAAEQSLASIRSGEVAARLRAALIGKQSLRADWHEAATTLKANSDRNRITAPHGPDGSELRGRLAALARLLRPMRAKGYTKKRFGSTHDGGWVMLDDFAGIKAAFSLGMARSTDWDLDMAGNNIPVYPFTCSANGASRTHSQCKFYPAMMGPMKDPIAFDALASSHSGVPLDVASAVMKMDIEHWEWPTLASAQAANLRKLRQLAVAFHGMHLIANPHWWLEVQAVLAKLRREFCVVHVASTAIGGASISEDMTLPNVLQVTFASCHYYEFEEAEELPPVP
jgi:hypothetical protein